MSLLPIHLLGDPILREETIPVTEFTDELRTLVDDMFETMYAASGIGLAAPQVGRRERLAVVDVEGAKYAIINPEIVLAEGKARAEEACLSFPDVYGTVERATRVIVQAQDVNGTPFEVEATDLLARCFQHEIDHLHGKLFIDYLSYLKRRAALAEWEELRKQYTGNIRHLKPGAPELVDPEHPEAGM
ncbi:MAG: peptide deformylase [Gemmatimonadetes bacterium]|nr:peptide deformylase [Gemmatimonadota bacterium]